MLMKIVNSQTDVCLSHGARRAKMLETDEKEGGPRTRGLVYSLSTQDVFEVPCRLVAAERAIGCRLRWAGRHESNGSCGRIGHEYCE